MLDASSLLTHADQLPEVTFEWGALKWYCNGAVLPGAAVTVGHCRIFVGHGNPLHYHPNCEEVLYVLAGEGKHLLGEEWVELKAGDTVRVPKDLRHKLVNTGTAPLDCLIVFSSPDRQTVFLEPV